MKAVMASMQLPSMSQRTSVDKISTHQKITFWWMTNQIKLYQTAPKSTEAGKSLLQGIVTLIIQSICWCILQTILLWQS